jgi:hypothetical protein
MRGVVCMCMTCCMCARSLRHDVELLLERSGGARSTTENDDEDKAIARLVRVVCVVVLL